MATPSLAPVSSSLPRSAPAVSVVCPFYNESQILEIVIRQLLEELASLEHDWELIVVNDGSTDGSGEIAARLADTSPRLRVLGYEHNRGRGHALRTGIAAARGDLIVTTEIDLSWGSRIVHELVAAMHRWPDADMVVASPHLSGGRYRNVPFKRVFLSTVGNWVIRACMANAATMNTGMTRAYRRQFIQSLPLTENGKEFHLEVILKGTAFGARIREIPAVLEWKAYKHQGKRIARKSSSRTRRLILSHSLFSIFANPIRYVWSFSLICLGLGVASFVWALYAFARGQVSVYLALLSMALVTLGILLFAIGIVLQQGNMIQRELWAVQRRLVEGERRGSEPATPTATDRPWLQP